MKSLNQECLFVENQQINDFVYNVLCNAEVQRRLQDNLSCHFVNPSPINRNADDVGLLNQLLL